jgi:hypothetical protein
VAWTTFDKGKELKKRKLHQNVGIKKSMFLTYSVQTHKKYCIAILFMGMIKHYRK